MQIIRIILRVLSQPSGGNVVKLELDRLEGLMSPGRGSTRAMWIDRANPKWRAVYSSLPHDEIWRTTSELFVLAQKSGLVRLGDDMGGLIGSMRKHNLVESQPAAKGQRHRLLNQPIVSPRPVARRIEQLLADLGERAD